MSEEDSDYSSSSESEISLSDLQRPDDYFRTELGEDTYEQVKAWLASKCQRYLILHRDRERGRSCHPECLDRSWKQLKADLLKTFPDIQGFVGNNRSDWGILGLFEDEVFEPWMILPDEYKEAGKRMKPEDAMALARIHCLVATADHNMTEFVCETLRQTPITPSIFLRSVEREANKRGQLDEYTAAFNFPAADDLARHLIKNV